jgi:hypothetical protein
LKLQINYKTDGLSDTQNDKEKSLLLNNSFHTAIIFFALLEKQSKINKGGLKRIVLDFESVSELFKIAIHLFCVFELTSINVAFGNAHDTVNCYHGETKQKRESFEKMLASLDDLQCTKAFKDLQETEIKLEQAWAKMIPSQGLLLSSKKYARNLETGATQMLKSSSFGRQKRAVSAFPRMRIRS